MQGLARSNRFSRSAPGRIAWSWGVESGETVDLLGFSGGAQRALVASRSLRRAGIGTGRVPGVAGPAGAFSCARRSTLLLVEPARRDPVVISARAVELFGLFPMTIEVRRVPGAGGHHTPFLPGGFHRTAQLGYAAALDQAMPR